MSEFPGLGTKRFWDSAKKGNRRMDGLKAARKGPEESSEQTLKNFPRGAGENCGGLGVPDVLRFGLESAWVRTHAAYLSPAATFCSPSACDKGW